MTCTFNCILILGFGYTAPHNPACCTKANQVAKEEHERKEEGEVAVAVA